MIAMSGASITAERLLSRPMTGSGRCCARAASGQSSEGAAPASSATHSRRFIRSPRRHAYSPGSSPRKRGPSNRRMHEMTRACPTPKNGEYWMPACAGMTAEFSFDYLVGAREQCRGHSEADRLRGLQIDHQVILGRRLHRQVSGLLAFEDAIDVTRRAAELIDKVRPVRDQAARRGDVALNVGGGKFVPGCKRDDQIAMHHRQRTSRDNHAAVRGARECRYGAFDLARVSHVHRGYFHPQRWRD